MAYFYQADMCCGFCTNFYTTCLQLVSTSSTPAILVIFPFLECISIAHQLVLYIQIIICHILLGYCAQKVDILILLNLRSFYWKRKVECSL